MAFATDIRTFSRQRDATWCGRLCLSSGHILYVDSSIFPVQGQQHLEAIGQTSMFSVLSRIPKDNALVQEMMHRKKIVRHSN